MAGLNQQSAIELAREYGGLYTGHFVGTQGEEKGSGLHMPEYFDSRTLVTYPKVIGKLAVGLAEMLEEFELDTIVGEPIGAYTLGHEVAKELGVRYAMAEKTPDSQVIARSAFIDVVAGRKVGIIEDTINAGETIQQGIIAVRQCKGDVRVVGALINRGPTTSDSLGVALRSLITLPMRTMTREQCLSEGQCSRSEPINRKPGHGHDLERLIAQGKVPDDPRYSFI